MKCLLPHQIGRNQRLRLMPIKRKETKEGKIFMFTYVITCFHESWMFYLKLFFWEKKTDLSEINIILFSYIAFYNSFLSWSENLFETDRRKRQISWKKFKFRRFGIRKNILWTCYRLPWQPSSYLLQSLQSQKSSFVKWCLLMKLMLKMWQK